MTIPSDEYGDLLRRAMRAEADSVMSSPDGLEIIRRRIEQRGSFGLRNIFWWRIGASVAAAALVAAAIVMIVPGLRSQVQTGIGLTNDSQPGQLPEIGATNQPPPSSPDGIVVVTVTPSRPAVGVAESTQTAPPSAKPTVATATPCASPVATPTIIEPSTTQNADCPPDESPPSPPPSPKPSPTSTPSAPTPSPTPSPCTGDGCQSPSPSASPGQVTAESAASAAPSS